MELTKESLPPYGTTGIDIGALINKPPRNSPNLEAGQRVFIYIPFEDITEDAAASIAFHTSTVCFFGFITFSGPDGIQRDSAFFRTYDTEREVFEPSTDPDYERN